MKKQQTYARELILYGMPVSKGIAEGVARVVYIEAEDFELRPVLRRDQIAEEIARIKKACQLLLVVIEHSEMFLHDHTPHRHLNLFAMHKILLEDKAFRDRMINIVTEMKSSAETAVLQVIDEYKRRLAESRSQFVLEKLSDLLDLRLGLIDALKRPHIFIEDREFVGTKLGSPKRIAVTKELTPRFVIEQHKENVQGILSEVGGKGSHAAILCRALEIPVVSALEDICDLVVDGDTVCVDGAKGSVRILKARRGVRASTVKGKVETTPRKALPHAAA
ncbi:MAG: hypothetical protein A2268_15595 [Candidatus Raymondbacteria bacterium RifOxyA12_full_50_37]|uniref:PEP-utilising enzyme mobile domain-containing protein n=1 Tax=Candidatus Raymondbacteria bacterium RIFOXYD12_FULL_49_13 TaxID=1817890 RepID=A0A1F7FIE3_UNCRA|nr:MAG: hypothetical protein A2268_15595 [Candidatus Raymondbacteria bacterium RifOxyA12_full_50_37]OGJ86116.1 MAG: hypothetical protein A2248_22195 [Candidatus Raymondbacteria bacterium RIFOXYA2_FULL_49_16]OGJ86473.1 MAG: hypothetical protein A2350_20550 [Candidatus Raymondbacteria bacterium RifOxyB12_full_50_8]OGJ95992.1 MAG: hypothetical protein A2453_05145 [Candidatus Raymondbacteria bacterium RIFOXYC2_FULL_50_21]OGK05616.1 MAG: hypothetical protein A2487_18395 [Candidatus Raymondbacteria b